MIRRLKERDERAFSEFVDHEGSRVFNLCFRLVGDRQEAEDLAQEVFITVFKSIDGFRGDSKLSTWLYRIASNLSKNRVKHLARRGHGSHEDVDGDSADIVLAKAKQENGPREQVERHQLEQLMQESISELEDDHRIVIILRDMEELSYEEICKITDLPEGTVKSRLHRARFILRTKMMSRM